MRFTAVLIGAASAAVADPCTRLCNLDGPAVCTGGSWNKNGVCHGYFFRWQPEGFLFRPKPALDEYCYHTTATAATCSGNGKPVKVADAEAILARAGDLRGRPGLAIPHDVLPPPPPVTTTINPGIDKVAEIERQIYAELHQMMEDFGITIEEAVERMNAKNPTTTTRAPTTTAVPVIPLADRRTVFMERTFGQLPTGIVRFSVNREKALEESLGFLNGPVRDLLTPNLYASFENEPGYGIGITKDWMNELTRQIFSPDAGFFTLTEDAPHYYKINAAGFEKPGGLDIYKAIGRFLALSITRNQPLGVNLPVLFFTRLLGKGPTLNDIREDEPRLAASMDFILGLQSDEELGDYDMTIGDRDYKLTLANRDLVIRFKIFSLDSLMELRAIAEVARGFTEVFPDALPFSAAELKQLILGTVDVDVDDLMANAKKELTDNQREMLHRVLRSFTPDEKRKFLAFVTNLNHVPVGGFARLNPPIWLRTNFHPDPKDHNLPRVLPCHHFIDIPLFANDDAMKEKLLHAMAIGHGWIK